MEVDSVGTLKRSISFKMSVLSAQMDQKLPSNRLDPYSDLFTQNFVETCLLDTLRHDIKMNDINTENVVENVEFFVGIAAYWKERKYKSIVCRRSLNAVYRMEFIKENETARWGGNVLLFLSQASHWSLIFPQENSREPCTMQYLSEYANLQQSRL